jgi:hypothetical protein
LRQQLPQTLELVATVGGTVAPDLQRRFVALLMLRLDDLPSSPFFWTLLSRMIAAGCAPAAAVLAATLHAWPLATLEQALRHCVGTELLLAAVRMQPRDAAAHGARAAVLGLLAQFGCDTGRALLGLARVRGRFLAPAEKRRRLREALAPCLDLPMNDVRRLSKPLELRQPCATHVGSWHSAPHADANTLEDAANSLTAADAAEALYGQTTELLSDMAVGPPIAGMREEMPSSLAEAQQLRLHDSAWIKRWHDDAKAAFHQWLTSD